MGRGLRKDLPFAGEVDGEDWVEWQPAFGMSVEVWKHEVSRRTPRGLKQRKLDNFSTVEAALAAAVELVTLMPPEFNIHAPRPPAWYVVRVMVRDLKNGNRPTSGLPKPVMEVPVMPTQSWQMTEDGPPVEGKDPGLLHALVGMHALVDAYYEGGSPEGE